MNSKRTIVVVILSLIIAIAVLLLLYVFVWKKPAVHVAKSLRPSFIVTVYEAPRESITFILGEDNNLGNPYYLEATDYYRSNREDRTEYLVITCRSLLEVRDYLEKNPPSNRRPWGLINFVSHGNPWTGMSVPIMPGSKRTTTDRLRSYMDDGSFRPLPDNLVDDTTEIFIHACGLGKDHELLSAISHAFGGEAVRPSVTASKLFEFYTSKRSNDMLIESRRYLAKAWFLYYKTGTVPPDAILCKELNEHYPNDTVDWADALTRHAPRYAGDTYTYTFDIPVKWVARYHKKDLLPDLSTNEKTLNWITQQTELSDLINPIAIPMDRFNWQTRNISWIDADKSKQPAIWVRGSTTILCILKPLVADSTETTSTIEPFVPSLDDTIYYWKE